ncbi:hypothetical protein Ddye_001120 [Dipteronia dyeriana]|uniref:CCHC-type domain-containing protein n=1 Tax=Dipteronia dyeriana TaxID=168575 RepID=A0AAE0CT77_9ROSI|nr:hypothetical protein Ddye_001120 [Dipteronia dyeriana]
MPIEIAIVLVQNPRASVVTRIWNLTAEVNIVVVTRNIFAFTFQNLGDRMRILAGGPWNFNYYLLVLEEPQGKVDMLNMRFNRAKFWVQIHSVPLLCMTKRISEFRGSIIGDVMEIDEGASGVCHRKFLRVRVIIDNDKPLRRCLHVDVLGDGVESVMLFQYERLPKHCFRCGRLGHKMRECIDSEGGKVARDDQELLFGVWLRATSHVKRTTHVRFWREFQFRKSTRSHAEGGFQVSQKGDDGPVTRDQSKDKGLLAEMCGTIKIDHEVGGIQPNTWPIPMVSEEAFSDEGIGPPNIATWPKGMLLGILGNG